jgi:serine/threonine protein kinase
MPQDFRLSTRTAIRSASAWYKVVQVLGAGVNASTYLVVATSGANKGVPFALKFFSRVAVPERRDDFRREIEFLKTCTHPSIMRVFDEGIYRDQWPFVVAEYLPLTLQQIIRSGTARTVEKVSYIVQLLSAISYLAALNPPVIHRDIKPANILIKGQSCILADFGLLKFGNRLGHAADQEALKKSFGAGMPHDYRTPDLVEYLRGMKPPSPKSDVFQLGLVAAELFTGSNPIVPCKDMAESVALNPVGKVPGAIGFGIANLIQRMLELDPDRRDPAAKFIDPWQGIFQEAVDRSIALEGRAF